MPASAVRSEYRTAPRSQITQSVDRNRLAAIPGAVHVEIARAQDLGAVAGAIPMEHIQIAMQRPVERQAAFDAQVEALQRKGDPSYHQWLTPETIGAEFGPSSSDIATVAGFLQAEGFTLNGVSKSGMIVDVSGTAALVQHTFHTDVHNYRLPDGKIRYSASMAAQIPAALAPAVASLVSLSNISAHPMHHVVPAYLNSSSQQMVGAQDFYAIYNEASLLATTTGAGQTIALIEETDINTADVTSFRTQFAVSPATPASLMVEHGSSSISCTDPGTTGPNAGDEDEAVLDTEWAGAVAPGASLLFMSCKTASTGGIILSAEAVVDSNLASVVSLSYGTTELGQASFGSFMSNLWEQAAAQGQTVVVSTADSGADTEDQGATIATHGLNVNLFATTPYNVAAGGTDFQDVYNKAIDSGTAYGSSRYWNTTNGTGDLTAKGYVAETTWDGSCASSLLNAAYEGIAAGPLALCEDASNVSNYLQPVGGSGGVSILNPRPSWQTGTVYGLPSAASVPNRVIPDVSLFASNGIWGHTLALYQADHAPALYGAGGTSFVAPQVAGIIALIAQKTAGRVGLAGPQLYSLAGTAFGTTTYAGTSCNGSGAMGVGETASVPSSSCVFYDVETGNNSEACTVGTANCYSDAGKSYGLLSTSTTAAVAAYPAAQGWDYATGIGSVNIGNLVAAWVDSTVTAQAATLSFVLQPTPYVYGSNLFPLAKVSGTNTISPTGTVAYSYNGSLLNTDALSDAGCVSGTCSSTASSGFYFSGANPAGAYFTVSAVYTSNSLYYNSGATGSLYVVFQKQTPTVVPAAVSFNYGTATANFSATVAYTGVAGTSAPTGGLKFSVDGGAAVTATCSGSSSPLTCTYTGYNTSALSSGNHTLTATEVGDGNYNALAATAAITISPSYSTLVVNGFVSPAIVTERGTVTVSALDENGAVYPGFTGTVMLTSSDNKATLPAAYTFTSSDNGVHAFNVTLSTVGSQSITASTGSMSGSQTGIVVDDAIWILNGGGGLAKLTAGGSAIASGIGGGGPVTTSGGAAADSSGTIWSVWTASSSLKAAPQSGSGATVVSSGGITYPSAVAVDGASMIWVANTPGSCSSSCAVTTVSEFSNAGAAVSPYPGYGSAERLNTPSAIAIDQAGDVWIADKKANTLTHILGAATPVMTPLSTATVNGKVGMEP